LWSGSRTGCFTPTDSVPGIIEQYDVDTRSGLKTLEDKSLVPA